MDIQKESKSIGGLINYFLLPAFCFVMSLKTWVWRIEPEYENLPHSNIIILVVLSAVVYEVGYKNYYKKNRVSYFLAIFIVPLLISVIGTVGGYNV